MTPNQQVQIQFGLAKLADLAYNISENAGGNLAIQFHLMPGHVYAVVVAKPELNQPPTGYEIVSL